MHHAPAVLPFGPAPPQDAAVDLPIPVPSLVVLCGAPGSGKSTWAARWFADDEVLSSDRARWMVSGDEGDQGATRDAFALVDLVLEARLRRGRLTVLDTTAADRAHRAHARRQATRHGWPATLVVFDLPAELCVSRAAARTVRPLPESVVRPYVGRLHAGLADLRSEGFDRVVHLRSDADLQALQPIRHRHAVDRRDHRGPFDLIGDVHGCFDELRTLLTDLGWVEGEGFGWRHPAGRTLVFLGDLVDRGPKNAEVLELAMATAQAGRALVLRGNHEEKLLRALSGRGRSNAGLQRTLSDLAVRGPAFTAEAARFLRDIEPHLVLAGGALVAAHGGANTATQGRSSGRARSFALYGDTTGVLGPDGYPQRRDWAATYDGDAEVVYGHTPVDEPTWVHRTINIDTGCVFGGKLTALRWPEREIRSVAAHRAWWPRHDQEPPP